MNGKMLNNKENESTNENKEKNDYKSIYWVYKIKKQEYKQAK